MNFVSGNNWIMNIMLFLAFILLSCNSGKQKLENSIPDLPLNTPVIVKDSFKQVSDLIRIKDSLLLVKAELIERKTIILQDIAKTSKELKEHDKQFRHKSTEYQEMLPTYIAVSETRETPAYKRLSQELGKAQNEMKQNLDNVEYKKMYDEKYKKYKNWEETSGRAALKAKLLPLRKKFIEYEEKSGRLALGNKLRGIEQQRIEINKELSHIEKLLKEIDIKI